MLFNPIGMTQATISMQGLTGSKSWARPHNAGRRPLELNDNYYRVPAASGIGNNIKEMSLWMIAQMGEMPDVLSPQVLNTIHAPLVKTPGERGRLRKFLERLGEADYGYGWRSYDYAGHRIVDHHRRRCRLSLADPVRSQEEERRGRPVEQQYEPARGLEFEVMDMIYGLEFRDWLELQRSKRPDTRSIARNESDEDISSGDGDATSRKRSRS